MSDTGELRPICLPAKLALLVPATFEGKNTKQRLNGRDQCVVVAYSHVDGRTPHVGNAQHTKDPAKPRPRGCASAAPYRHYRQDSREARARAAPRQAPSLKRLPDVAAGPRNDAHRRR